MKLKLLVTLLAALIGAQSVFGAAATIAYVWPVAGATAPTAAQAAKVNSVVADITWAAAADTAVVMTHNMVLPNATGANARPKITWFCTSMGAGTFVPFFAFTSGTTITIDKNSTATGSTGVCRVTIERPHSIIR